jgi:CheY-like chemotaxis protein
VRAVAPSGGYRILLVDDNPHVVELYRYVVQKLARTDGVGIEAEVALDTAQALERLAEQSFDLLVTDLFMPGVDGFELIRRVRGEQATRELPVVAITAGGDEAQMRASAAGATVCLRKPARFDEVAEVLRTQLRLGERASAQ